MTRLDIEAVRAFVLIADLQSFTQTAELLNTTQSTVSLRIKRLEADLGRRLLERTPRRVRLSTDGSVFLTSARALVAAHQGALEAFSAPQARLTLGISHHLVGAELPVVLRHLAHAQPRVTLELRVAASRDLLEQFDTGTLDAIIVLQHDNRRQDGEIIARESFGWIGASDFKHSPGQPLRIATQPSPCSVRSMAVSALEAAGVRWSEVFVGGGVNTLGAAVSAGLAVAALAHRVMPPGTLDLGARLGLPPLPTRDMVLYSNLSDRQTRQTLRQLTTALTSGGLREPAVVAS